MSDNLRYIVLSYYDETKFVVINYFLKSFYLYYDEFFIHRNISKYFFYKNLQIYYGEIKIAIIGCLITTKYNYNNLLIITKFYFFVIS